MAAYTQSIRHCTTRDGITLAYSTIGSGPQCVEVATWLNHLESDLSSPVWGPRIEALGSKYAFLRYDGRGCGLSDRDVDDLSFESWVRDLEAVADSAKLNQFSLIGCCQGSGVAVAYATRHPERVERLVLYGAFARGRLRRNTSDKDRAEVKTMLDLIRLGWGNDNPAFRQVYKTIFIPDSTPEEAAWFTDLQRMSTSADNAVRLVSAFNSMDVSDLLPQVRCPTLVIHATGDARVPLEEGRRVARAIPGAEFITLESQNHILLPHQPAWRQFLDEIGRFFSQGTSNADPSANFLELTERERDVLNLIASGLDNTTIASQFRLSEKTVRNHINSIFGKLGVPNRAQAIVRAREAGFGTKVKNRVA
jgi:pimeloyl-ACP methyl ester carboxylesterase/DNA-binding CsgD family transcriptional regulator